MSDGELLDAREAMSLLGINETDLQTMVARGDLRAFRSAGTMKFRRDDVLNIKTEKKTDPTIPVIPPEKPKAKPGSGILPTVSGKTGRASSKNLPTVKPTIPAKPAARAATVDSGTSSDQIILEEFELAPSEVDPVTSTQQITAQQTAVAPGGVTVVDSAVETGNVTVVEQGVDTVDTASATASAIAPVAVPASGQQRKPSSRIAEALPAAPAMSRVRAAVSASGQSAASKRAQASAQARTGHPIMTLVLVLTTGILLYAATIVGVQLVAGNYNERTMQRVIPPFLTDAPLWNYRTAYDNLPGKTDDSEGTAKRPSGEYGGGK